MRLGHDTLPSAKAGGNGKRVEGLDGEDKLVHMVHGVHMLHTMHTRNMLHTRNMRNDTQRYRARVTTYALGTRTRLHQSCVRVLCTHGQPNGGQHERDRNTWGRAHRCGAPRR